MEFIVECPNIDWIHTSSFIGQHANSYTTAPWYKVYQICELKSSMVDGDDAIVIMKVISHYVRTTYTIVQIPAMKSKDGSLRGCTNRDWIRVSIFLVHHANHNPIAPLY